MYNHDPYIIMNLSLWKTIPSCILLPGRWNQHIFVANTSGGFQPGKYHLRHVSRFHHVKTMRPWHWHWGETMWFFIGGRGQQKHYWSEKKNVLGEWGGLNRHKKYHWHTAQASDNRNVLNANTSVCLKVSIIVGESIRSATYWNQWVCFFFFPPSF